MSCKNHATTQWLLFVLCFIAFINLTGCAVGVPIRASEQIVKENHIQSITVLEASRVVWPRMGNNEPVIGLQASKQTLAAVTPLLKGELAKKGYQVEMKEVGVFSHPNYKDNWVYPADGEYVEPEETSNDTDAAATKGLKEKEDSAENAMSNAPYKAIMSDPVFLNAAFTGDPETMLSAKAVFEFLDQSILFPKPAEENTATESSVEAKSNTSENTASEEKAATATEKSDSTLAPKAIDITQPPVEAIQNLAAKYDTDLICFSNTTGQRYTAGRKTGAIALGVLTALISGVAVIPGSHDVASILLACYNPKAELVWGGSHFIGDPEAPNADGFVNLLTYFPAMGKTLENTCKAEEKRAMMYSCSGPTQTASAE